MFFPSKENHRKVIGNGLHSELLAHESGDWKKVQNLGLYNHCMPKNGSSPTYGKILPHCKSKVSAFREKMGIRLCVFKLGCHSKSVDTISHVQGTKLFFNVGPS